MNQHRNYYYVAAVLSIITHVSIVGVFNHEMLSFARLPKPKIERVELELVYQEVPKEEVPRVPSSLIEEQNARSQDMTQTEERGALPQIAGEGETKTVSQGTVTEQLQQEQRQEKMVTESVRETVDDDEPYLAQEIKEDKMKTEDTDTSDDIAIIEDKGRLFNNLVSEATDIGQMQIATQQDQLVPYLKNMRMKIFKEWYPIVAFKAGAMPSSRVVLEFKILPSGVVEDVTVLQYEGSEVFPEVCAAAIQSASPFDALPVELPAFLKEKYLRIRFTFNYD